MKSIPILKNFLILVVLALSPPMFYAQYVMAKTVNKGAASNPHHGVAAYLRTINPNIPGSWAKQISASITQRGADYSGDYVPACINAKGQRFELRGEWQAQPGEMLSMATGDPAIKDRSLSYWTNRWTPYYEHDFMPVCQFGSSNTEYCDPVTYYTAYQARKAAGQPTDAGALPPHVFMYIPAHMIVAKSRTTSLGQMIGMAMEIDAITDDKTRFAKMHAFLSWLKGDDRQTYSHQGKTLPALRTNHFTGMGENYITGLMIPHSRLTELAKPRLTDGLIDILTKLMTQNPDFSKTYEASFQAGMSQPAYDDFKHSAPFSLLYENLAYADDPVLLEQYQLQANTDLACNVSLQAKGSPQCVVGHVLRGVLHSSSVSTLYDAAGFPVVNDKPQRPPSGLCLEEASFYLHPSMAHTPDGWAMTYWVAGDDGNANGLMLKIYQQYRSLKAAWNTHYQAIEETVGQKLLYPNGVKFNRVILPHVEIWDNHVFIPHGNADGVKTRLNALLSMPEQQRSQYAALGYQTPGDWPCDQNGFDCSEKNACDTVTCGLDDLGIQAVNQCTSAACVNPILSVFDAAYAGVLSRLSSSLAQQHRPAAAQQYLAMVQRRFNDPIAEVTLDKRACRENTQDIFLIEGCALHGVLGGDHPYETAAAIAADLTPIPMNDFGKMAVAAENYAFAFNHLWVSGSLFPIHQAAQNQHLPRYWNDHPNAPGVVSYQHFEAGSSLSYPNDFNPAQPNGVDYQADWWINDTFGYRQTLQNSNVLQFSRTGRGDIFYLLQYFPSRLLHWGHCADNDEDCGTNLPHPSFSPY